MKPKPRNPGQRLKDKAYRQPQKSVRIKRPTAKKATDRSVEAVRTMEPEQNPSQSKAVVSKPKFETIEVPPLPVQPSPAGSSTAGESVTLASAGSCSQGSAPLGPKPSDVSGGSPKRPGFLGHIQEMYGWTEEAAKKREQQKLYMEQLQQQIREKEQLKSDPRAQHIFRSNTETLEHLKPVQQRQSQNLPEPLRTPHGMADAYSSWCRNPDHVESRRSRRSEGQSRARSREDCCQDLRLLAVIGATLPEGLTYSGSFRSFVI